MYTIVLSNYTPNEYIKSYTPNPNQGYGSWSSQIIFSPGNSTEALAIEEANISLEAGKSGSFSFKVPLTNTFIDEFKVFTSYVDIYRDNDVNPTFSGRVISVSEDFNLSRTIICEGMYGVFNDTVLEPFTYDTSDLRGLLNNIIGNHNNQVEQWVYYEKNAVEYKKLMGSDKKITIGNVEVVDSEGVYRAYESYEKTISRLDDLVNAYGGYMIVRKEYDQSINNYRLYLDWLKLEISDYEHPKHESTQTIDFGSNLLDVTQEVNPEELITVLVPIGGEKEVEQDYDDEGTYKPPEYVMLMDDQRYLSNYIENTAAIRQFGRIVGINHWDDVYEPVNLYIKGNQYLTEKCKTKVNVKVNAVDLANAGYSVDNFAIGDIIKVNSLIHGFDEKPFIVKSLNINILDPSSDELELGDENYGYIASMNKNQKLTANKVERIERNYVTNQNMYDVDKNIHNTTISLYSAINQLPEQITSEVKQEILDENDSYGIKDYISTQITQTSDQILLEVHNTYDETVEDVNKFFTFNTDGLTISSGEDNIRAVLDNDSYTFETGSEENPEELLRIDTDGMSAKTVTSFGQIAIGQKVNSGGQLETYKEWALRLGSASGGKHNFNIVWIGGSV